MAKILLLDDEPRVLTQAITAIQQDSISILLVPEYQLNFEKEWKVHFRGFDHTLLIAMQDVLSPEFEQQLADDAEVHFGERPVPVTAGLSSDQRLFGLVPGWKCLDALLREAVREYEDLIFCSSDYDLRVEPSLLDIVVSDLDLGSRDGDGWDGFNIIQDLTQRSANRIMGLLYSAKPNLEALIGPLAKSSIMTCTKGCKETFPDEFTGMVAGFIERVRSHRRSDVLGEFKKPGSPAHFLTHFCGTSKYGWAEEDEDTQLPTRITDPAKCASWWQEILPQQETEFAKVIRNVPTEVADDIESVVAMVNGRLGEVPDLDPADPDQERLALDTATEIRRLYARISWPLSDVLVGTNAALPTERMQGLIPDSFTARTFLYAGTGDRSEDNLVRRRLSAIAANLHPPWHWRCIGDFDQLRWLAIWQEPGATGDPRGGPFGYENLSEFVRRSDPESSGTKEGWGWLYDLSLSFDVYLERICDGSEGGKPDLVRLTWKEGLKSPSDTELPPDLEPLGGIGKLRILLNA